MSGEGAKTLSQVSLLMQCTTTPVPALPYMPRVTPTFVESLSCDSNHAVQSPIRSGVPRQRRSSGRAGAGMMSPPLMTPPSASPVAVSPLVEGVEGVEVSDSKMGRGTTNTPRRMSCSRKGSAESRAAFTYGTGGGQRDRVTQRMICFNGTNQGGSEKLSEYGLCPTLSDQRYI